MGEYPTDTASLRRLLHDRRTGVLAMTSGGCGRYIFSTDVAYEVDVKGNVLLSYESPNPHHHHLMSHSGLSLMIDVEKNPDGSDHCKLVLVGQIKPTRADDTGSRRQYRFDVDRAHLSLESGESIAVPRTELL